MPKPFENQPSKLFPHSVFGKGCCLATDEHPLGMAVEKNLHVLAAGEFALETTPPGFGEARRARRSSKQENDGAHGSDAPYRISTLFAAETADSTPISFQTGSKPEWPPIYRMCPNGLLLIWVHLC